VAEFSFGHLFAGPPDLGKIEELVRCCERRQARAADKLAAAQAESAAAEAAYEVAVSARADWVANGPDAQLMML
jgi:hypothetical protein